MKLTHQHPQIIASKPYDGFWFQPVIQAERSREKVQHEELPTRMVDRHSTVNSRQRG